MEKLVNRIVCVGVVIVYTIASLLLVAVAVATSTLKTIVSPLSKAELKGLWKRTIDLATPAFHKPTYTKCWRSFRDGTMLQP